MRIPDNGGNQERILVLVPTRRDAHLSDRILTEAGFECVVHEDLDHLCRELRSGAGAVLLTDEVVENARIGVLLEYLAGQPSWSDLSLLVLAQGGVDSPRAVRALESLGNVTLLEMPVRATTLVSALRAALRARRRQYQLREHLLERERSSEALRESEERLRLALCASETGTFHQDFQSRMLACDENLLQLLGLPSDRSLDEFDRFLELVHPADRQSVIAAGERSLREGTDLEIEYRIVHPDGATRWLHTKGRTIFDSEKRPLYLTGACADITKRREADMALRDTNAKLKLLSQTASLLLEKPQQLVDRLFGEVSGRLGLEIYFNYRTVGGRLHLESWRGIPEEVAREVEWLDFGQAVCGTVALTRQRMIAENIQESSDKLTELLRSLGISAFVCHPLVANDRLNGTLSFGTRFRETFSPEELELLQTISNQAAVAIDRANLITELQTRVEELAKVDRRKDEFLAMLAHELRNPLATILFGLETLKLFPPDHPSFLDARSIIERKITYMTRLLDDLLDVSRITRGKIKLRRFTLDLSVVVSRAVESMRGRASEREQSLAVDLPPAPIWLEGDPTRLEQVITNLLQNAVKYTDPGGRIHLSVVSQDHYAEVHVKDTGIGIPSDLLPRIFEPFTQGDQALDRSFGGLGIGLTLVAKLVELHGGQVEAFSEGPGKGSEFVVRLPVRTEQAAPGSRMRQPRARPAPSRRILVVDDNVESAKLLGTILEKSGHHVWIAYDGPTAVEEAARSIPDVVLLDIGLPGMDGYEVARKLRELPSGPGPTLIALTGYGQEEDRRRSRDAGIDYHLVKPIVPEVLEPILHSLSGPR